MYHRSQVEALARIAKLIAGECELERIVQTITDSATELSGAKFAAFLYNLINDRRESYALYALSGAPRSAFETFGLPRNTAVFEPTFRGTSVVRSDDIRRDPRYGHNAPHLGMPKGHPSIVSYLAVPVLSGSGEVLGGLFFGHDQPAVFTQDAEDIVSAIAVHAGLAIDNARVQHASHRLASIIASSDDAIYSIDLDGIITSWNAAAQRLFGYEAAEVIGKPVTVLIPTDRQDQETAILERIQRGEHVEHYETVRQCKDGSLTEISITVSPLKDVHGRIVGASKISRDITERKLLIAEVEHRVKNTLAMVQALASLTLTSASPEQQDAFRARLHALARANDLLQRDNWNRALLGDVVARAVRPFPREQIEFSGPEVVVTGTQSQLLTLALHELATNAAKYGALSNGRGRVHINWISFDGRLQFGWHERGGPPVEPPRRKGFGSLLIEKSFATQEGRTEIEYAPEGVTCTLEIAV